MNFGKFEQRNIDEDKSKIDSIDDLSTQEVIEKTSSELAALKMNIINSKQFLKEEKNSFAAQIDNEAFQADISREKEETDIEVGVNNELGSLLGDIRNTVLDDKGNSNIFNKADFARVRSHGSPETYLDQKAQVTEKHKDLLMLWTINNYFENGGRFRAVEGSAEAEFINEYNNETNRGLAHAENAKNAEITEDAGNIDINTNNELVS